MPRPTQPLVITAFKGENDQSDHFEMDDSKGSIVQNLYKRGLKMVRRKGYAPISSSLGNHQLQGFSWFFDTLSREWVVGIYQGAVYDFWNSGGGFADAPTALTGGTNQFLGTAAPVSMAIVDGILYMGGDDPGGPNNAGSVRFNGTNCASVGQPKPATVPTIANGSAGAVPAGVLQYVVTYIDTDGHESEPSGPSLQFTSDGAHQITVTLPDVADSQRSGKNVYRSGVNSSDYKLCNSSPLAGNAATYTDVALDAALGATAIFGNTRFPRCSLLWQHDGRLWGALGPVDNQTIYISNYLEPWYCPIVPNLSDPNQGMTLRIQSKSSYVNGGASYGGYSVIFSGDGGYLVQGVDPNSYNMQKFTDHGCAAHRTIRAVRDQLYWLGTDGVYRFDGQNTMRVSQDEWEFFSGLTAANLSQAVSWVYDDRYYISLSTGCRYLDTHYGITMWKMSQDGTPEYGGWGRLAGVDVTDASNTVVTYQGNAGTPRIFAAPRGIGSIYQLEKNTDGDRNTANTLAAIACEWKSRIWDMGQQSRDKRVHLFGGKFLKGTGTAVINLLIGAGDSVQTVNFDTSTTDDYWYNATNRTVSVSRNEATDMARSEFFQLDITHADATATDFQILEAEVHWTLAG